MILDPVRKYKYIYRFSREHKFNAYLNSEQNHTSLMSKEAFFVTHEYKPIVSTGQVMLINITRKEEKMVKSIKANDLLSRAEIGIIAAEEVFKERNLEELNGQLSAVGKIIDSIRAESTEGVK